MSGSHPLPAFVLARYECDAHSCPCEFPPPRMTSEQIRKRSRESRAVLDQQVKSMVLVSASTDAVNPLHQAVEYRLHKLADARRRNRAKFANVGALLFDTCSCCYRYVLQNKDQLGRREQYLSRLKGVSMRDDQTFHRFRRLLPHVMRDLLRRYNLRHGTVHTQENFPTPLRRSMWICPACISYFRKEKWKKFPPTSMENNLLLADVPHELARLSHYERHMVARVRSFHQLLYLPFGQHAARGLCISYPSDTLTLVDSLPTTIEDSDIVIIRQAPDNKSTTKPLSVEQLQQLQQQDAYRQSTQEREVSTSVRSADSSHSIAAASVASSSVPRVRRATLPVQFKVRPNLIKVALRWLVEENELYRELRVTNNLDDLEVDENTQEVRLTSDSESDAQSRCETAADVASRDQRPDGPWTGRLRQHGSAAQPATSSSAPSRDASSDDEANPPCSPSTSRLPAASSPSSDAEEVDDGPMLVDHVTPLDPTPLVEPQSIRDRLLHIGEMRNAAHHPIMQIRRASGVPVRINYQRASEALAYPGIFPTGDNHYGTFRFPLTPLQYFRSRLMAYRERCLREPTYIFFAMNAVDWQQLESAVSIHFQMRTGTARTALSHHAVRSAPVSWQALHDPSHRPGVLTKLQLEQHATANTKDQFVEETCHTFMQNMRGTLAYWNKCKRDLFSMIRMLGPPTWFVTFSADEFGWIECLMSAGGLTREQAELLTMREKQELIANNPDMVSQYFDYRWSKFFSLVLHDKVGSPLGKIVDHFWRIEFQRRGSPHVHMLLWIDGAPRADCEADKQRVADFIARHVSTEVPQEEGELRDLVLRLQQHAHTPTCTRTKKGTVKSCRFHFPRPVCDETRMVTSDDRGLPKRTLYVTRRTVDDVNTNAYNPELLLAWRGNMDIQFINSLQGVVAYVSAYMTKDEPEGFRAAIQTALDRLPSNANKRAKMMRMGATILSKRELPAQEACYRLLGLSLRESSRTFVTVNSRPEQHRTRVLKPHWRDEADESTDLFQMGVIQRYVIRPHSGPTATADDCDVDWDRMTLAHFASNYLRVASKSRPRIGAANDTTTGRTHRLLDGQTWIRKVKKEMVVQTPLLTSEKDGQAYYYSLLMLHIPFRDESELLQGRSPMEAFCHRSSELSFADRSRIYQDQLADEVQRAVNQLHVLRVSGALDFDVGITHATDMDQRAMQLQMSFAIGEPTGAIRFADLISYSTPDGVDELRPNYLLNRDDFIEDDAGATFGTMADDVIMNGAEAYVAELGESAADRVAVNPNPPMPTAVYDQLVKSLNVQQRAIFDQVVRHTSLLYRNGLVHSRQGVSPLKLFVSGGGGTGKSHLLRALKEHIMMATRNLGCVVCAPTGVAAFNVGGRTIHGLLAIPVDQQNRYSALIPPLRDDVLREKVQLFQHVDYLIIDEISMVSENMLCKINARLNQIKSNGKPPPNMDFGGISVIVIGDLFQLRPVKDGYVFDHCIHLWRQFTLNELTANERQSSDPTWSALLERIRIGDTRQASADMRTLRRRLTVAANTNCMAGSHGHVDDTGSDFRNALRIYHTNDKVHQYNVSRTDDLSLLTTVYKFQAEHVVVTGEHHGLNNHQVPKHWIPTSDDDCGGLTDIIHIGVGSRVMLRRNISVSEGLVNGACGTVVSFEWNGRSDGPTTPGELPAGVNVRFDDPRVGVLSQSRVLTSDASHAPVLIEPRFSRFNGVGESQRCQIQRRQLPLMLCWAATVHKVQGLTLDRAVIDLDGAFTNASAYVALSRVRSLSGVALSSVATVKKIWRASPTVTKEYDRLRVLMTILPAVHSPKLPSIQRKKTRSSRAVSEKGKRQSRDFVVERIVGKRFDEKGIASYLIKWLHYDDEDNTWEPRGNLRGCEPMLRQFEKDIYDHPSAHAGIPARRTVLRRSRTR